MRSIALVLVMTLAGCGSGSMAMDSPEEVVPLALRLTPSGGPVVVDGTRRLYAVTGEGGNQRTVQWATWSSANPAVATLSEDAWGVFVRGKTEGTTTITARSGNEVASLNVTVLSAAQGQGGVRIRDFQVVEFLYPAGQYVYGPIGVIEETDGGQVDITSMELVVPGVPTTLAGCGSLRLDSRATRPLNPDGVGDFGFEVYANQGLRAAVDQPATVRLHYRTGAGNGTLELQGPIVHVAAAIANHEDPNGWTRCP